MEAFIANKDNEKLLRVYLLKAVYDLTKGLEKELLSSLTSCCLVIRRVRIKNETEFGYKQSLKTGLIKKIHFIYLATVEDLTSFLWAQLNCEKPLVTGIFIDSIQEYFGERFSFQENGRAISICLNLLEKLSQKTIGKKSKVKVGFSFCFNSYVFHRVHFNNYMRSNGVVIWEVSGREVLKNGHQFENEWTKSFFEQYGPIQLKQQAEE